LFSSICLLQEVATKKAAAIKNIFFIFFIIFL
jgi:hypothetical protein